MNPLKNRLEKAKVASCVHQETQRATFGKNSATGNATTAQQIAASPSKTRVFCATCNATTPQLSSCAGGQKTPPKSCASCAPVAQGCGVVAMGQKSATGAQLGQFEHSDKSVAAPVTGIGTTVSPPGLTPVLLAASLALDAQIAASGVETGDPDECFYPHTQSANTGERIADRLLERDREHDDRHACLECSSLTGCPGNWRCMAFRARGARDPGLPRDLVGMLARCPTYTSGQPVIDVYASVKALPPPPPLRPQQQYHPLTPDQQQLARTYHDHHFGCAKCRVAGQNRGERCQRGVELWNQYQEGTTQ